MLNLKLLHQRELNLLKQIITICEEEGINYWLSGGSLLGAMKYKGIIPWDDDIDVAMLRPDYDRFIAAATEKFKHSTQYGIINDLNDPDYGVTWSKVTDKNTQIKEDFKFSSQKVFIDITPFDKVADNPVLRLWDKYYFHVLNQLVYERYDFAKHSLCGYLLYGLFHLASRWFSLDKLKQMRYRAMTKRQNSSCQLAMNFASWYDFADEWVTFSELSHLETVPFEDLQVTIPQGTASILQRMYGDISQTPDKSKQRPAHVKAFRVTSASVEQNLYVDKDKLELSSKQFQF